MTPRQPGSVMIEASEGVTVYFEWHGDRFRQRVLHHGMEVGESLEGDADDPWPPSPPIQQLSLETIDGSRVLLGVGGAGRGHWSISAAMEPQGQSLKFELACRSADVPSFLGSTYRMDHSMTLTPLDASWIDLPYETDVTSPWRIQAVRPRRHSPEPTKTQRWAYRLEPASA